MRNKYPNERTRCPLSPSGGVERNSVADAVSLEGITRFAI